MKVHLLSSNHDSAQENNWEVPIDPSLREVTVSLSGPAPQIELTDPFGRKPFCCRFLSCHIDTQYSQCTQTREDNLTLKSYCCVPGRIIGEEQGLKELLNIPNSARIVNLKFPRPGAWKLKVLLNNSWICFFDIS